MGHTHIAARAFPYAGGRLEAGQVFTPASESDAFVLTHAGLARPIEADAGEDQATPVVSRRRGRPRKAAVE